MTTTLSDLSLAAMLEGLERGDFSAVELTREHLQAARRIEALNAWVALDDEGALRAAARSDARRRDKAARPLDGLPFGAKDMFCAQGMRTTAASEILGDFTPSYDAFVIRRLREDGAILIGKLNQDEFAMGSSSERSRFGPVVNPRRRRDDATPLTAGGSSGGSAAAVAAGSIPLALGTDTGGSIRQPAGLTGVVGFKPSYGRCSRWGIIAFASSLDQAGVLVRSVADAAIALRSVAGFDENDATGVDRPTPDYPQALSRSAKGLRIGVPAPPDDLPDAALSNRRRACDALRAAGMTLHDIDLPLSPYALPAYYIIACAEASSNLARYDGLRYGRRARSEKGDDIAALIARSRSEGFGEEVQRRILIGTYVLSAGYYDAYYLKAQRIRRRIADDYAAAFAKVDLIVTPTTPTAAFALGSKTSPVAMYLNDILTVGANLAGLPAISVPFGVDPDGLPLGIQLIGRPFDEETVLLGAARLEEAAPNLGEAAPRERSRPSAEKP